MSESDSELDQLLLALSQGALSDTQRERLEELVRDDEAARERHFDYISVDAMLRFRSGGGEVTLQEPERLLPNANP